MKRIVRVVAWMPLGAWWVLMFVVWLHLMRSDWRYVTRTDLAYLRYQAAADRALGGNASHYEDWAYRDARVLEYAPNH